LANPTSTREAHCKWLIAGRTLQLEHSEASGSDIQGIQTGMREYRHIEELLTQESHCMFSLDTGSLSPDRELARVDELEPSRRLPLAAGRFGDI
jgi:hypothetical protein